MGYNAKFWEKYADENESRVNDEFTKFITDLATALHCSSILEIGCGTGIDHQKYNESFVVNGLDLNNYALIIEKKNLI